MGASNILCNPTLYLHYGTYFYVGEILETHGNLYFSSYLFQVPLYF